MRGGETGRGAGECRPDGIPLLGHRRGRARAGGDLADLRLGEEQDVERDLRGCAGGDGERTAESRDACAVRVPGEGRHGQVELLGVQLEHADALVAEAGERPRGSAELGSEALLGDLGQRRSSLGHPDQPAGCLEPERRRHCLLEQGARGHRRRPVLPSQGGARRDDPVGFVQHELDRPAGDQHRRRVEDVLARGAAVHVARGVVSDGRGERSDERLDGVSGRAAVLEELREVEAGGVARRLDLGRRRGGHEPGGGCCARERALGREHSLEPRAAGDGGAQAGRYEQRLERRHAAIVVGHGTGNPLLRRVPVIGTVSWIFDIGVLYTSRHGRPRGGRARHDGPRKGPGGRHDPALPSGRHPPAGRLDRLRAPCSGRPSRGPA